MEGYMTLYKSLFMPVATALAISVAVCNYVPKSTKNADYIEEPRKSPVADFEQLDSNSVRAFLKGEGMEHKDIAEYMAVFPWADDIANICSEWDIEDEKIPIYMAKILTESSGNPHACSKKWFARGLMGLRYAGAFDEIWQMVHNDDPKYKRMRKDHPEIYAYFKEELNGVSKPLELWNEMMVNKKTLDPEFGIRLGIAYFEILDSEDHISDTEKDDKTAEAKYLLGTTRFRKNPNKAMKDADNHIKKVWERRDSFDSINRTLVQHNEVARNHIRGEESFIRKRI